MTPLTQIPGSAPAFCETELFTDFTVYYYDADHDNSSNCNVDNVGLCTVHDLHHSKDVSYVQRELSYETRCRTLGRWLPPHAVCLTIAIRVIKVIQVIWLHNV